MLNTLNKSLIGAAAALTVAGTSLTHAEEQAPVLLLQVQLDAEDPSGQALTAFYDKILPGTISYEGNQSAQYFVSKEDPSQILLLEEWDSQEDFDAYLNWRIERGDFGTLQSLLDAEPVVRFFERKA